MGVEIGGEDGEEDTLLVETAGAFPGDQAQDAILLLVDEDGGGVGLGSLS